MHIIERRTYARLSRSRVSLTGGRIMGSGLGTSKCGLVAESRMNCEYCKIEHTGVYGSGRFCSERCAKVFATKMKRKEINRKLHDQLKGLRVSIATLHKVLRKLGFCCSFCGWCEYNSQIHHIRGRNIENPDSLDNLAYLCPNCHKLADVGIIPTEWLTSLLIYFPDDWEDRYYS